MNNKIYKTELNIWTNNTKDYIANDLAMWAKYNYPHLNPDAVKTIAQAAMVRFQVELLKQDLIKNINPDKSIALS